MFEPHFVEAWEPSPKEYAAYRRREFELAQQNIAFLVAKYGKASEEDTLHSPETFERAYVAVLVEKSTASPSQ